MEKQVETPFSFPPYRRSHLQSETYRTFVRIMSHCYGSHSQVSLDTPQSPIPDNGGGNSKQATEIEVNECRQLVDSVLEDGEDNNGGVNSGQATENGENECGQLVDPGLGPGSLPASIKSCEAIEFKEMDIDEIDKMMGTDGVDDFLNMDMFVDNDNEATGSDQQQTLMDELMGIVTENEEIVHDNNGDNIFESPKNDQIGNVGVIFPTNQGENVCHQENFMLASEGLAQLPIDVQCSDQKTGEDCYLSADISADKDMTTKEIGSSANIRDTTSFSPKTNDTEVHHKELQLENPVVDNGTGQATDLNSVDGVTEEGEISGDLDINEEIINMEISEDLSSKKELAFNPQSAENDKDSERNPSIMDTVDKINTSKKVEIEPSGRRNLVYYGEIMDDKLVEDQDVELKEKKNTDICSKKKRGVLSQEKKIKKKQRERKKRAEKNQKLGVKRLKLQTVLKPKPVTVCRHYLKGRCQEGDKCKFSHDAVPLTKSEPCRYFARHLCMKGDDCPFDHQLSKYPCTNFIDTGFCSRGDNCMFSHKIPLKDSTTSTSNVSKTELKPPSLSGNSDSKMPLKAIGPPHQKVNTSSNPIGDVPFKNPGLKMAEALLKQPKGVSFLSMVGLDGIKQDNSSPIVKANQSGEVLNNINEIPKKVAPKGINFLSFGKTPTLLKDSGTKKPISSHLNVEDPLKSSLNKLNIFKQGSSNDYKNDGFDLSNRTAESASATNEILTVSQPQGMDFRSIGNDQRDESKNQQCSNNDVKNTYDKIQYSLRRLSASPGISGEGQQTNSAQKALISTLAFAAKFESQMKMINQGQATASTSVVDKGKVDNCENSPNVSDRASKILKFLSTPGNPSKQ